MMRWSYVVALAGCKGLLGIEDPSNTLLDAPVDMAVADADADARIDADPDPDRDNVLENDNCPMDANSDQNDEDSDGLGDPCDPCPIATINTDTDGDRVGDLCDPNPGTAGDTIVAFWGFASAPTTAGFVTVGTWMIDNGIATVSGSLDSVATLTIPSPSPSTNTTITARVVVDQIFGTNNVRSAGAVTQLDPGNGRGVVCGPGINASNDEGLFVVDTATSQAMIGTLAIAPGLDVVIRGTRVSNLFGCERVATGNSVSITDSYSVGSPRQGVRTRSMSARFHYVLIVRS